MTADEIRKFDKDFENNKLDGEVVAVRSLIEIAAQLSDLNETLKSFDKDEGTRILDVKVRPQ